MTKHNAGNWTPLAAALALATGTASGNCTVGGGAQSIAFANGLEAEP